jgi:hypothetical protein
VFSKDIKPATGFYEISKLVAPMIGAEIEFTPPISFTDHNNFLQTIRLHPQSIK